MLSPIIRKADPINEEEFADLLTESEIMESLDTGPTLIHKVAHPQRGELLLVSQFRGTFGVVSCN